jgi:UPF0755 protein
MGALVTLSVAGAGLAAYLLLVYPDTPGPGTGHQVVVEVPWGGGARGVASQAAKAGVLRSELRFVAYLRLTGIAPRLKAGRHLVRDDWTPAQIAAELTKQGLGRQLRVTIREGWSRFDIADELERLDITSREGFLEATMNRALLDELGLEGESAEGYLFPETYLMAPDTEAEAVVRRLVATFQRRAGAIFERRPEALGELERTATDLERELGRGEPGTPDGSVTSPFGGRHVAIILASMVEAETARTAERPLVAAVMLNRLRSPDFPSRKLQIDPTVAYGCRAAPSEAPSCRRGATPLTTRHLEDGANRYNTYTHPGLPPGPIGNPSLTALEAVLSPAESDVFYFVADGEGSHVFSSTLAEHNRAVARYRARRDGRDPDVPAGSLDAAADGN